MSRPSRNVVNDPAKDDRDGAADDAVNETEAPQYIVAPNRTVQLNGKRYAAGETVPVGSSDAEWLLDAGFIRDAEVELDVGPGVKAGNFGIQGGRKPGVRIA